MEIIVGENRLEKDPRRVFRTRRGFSDQIANILYAESITINPATSTAESAHGVSWCAEIGRPTYAFAYVAPPFSVPFC